MTTILVEGVDGSGKSTLIEQARGNQKDRYFIKLQAARYQPTIQAAIRYLHWIRISPHDLVLDRFHFLSDRVYGPILRNENIFKDLPISFGLQSLDAIIYCRPPTPKILENVTNNKHLTGVAENIHALIQEYDNIMRFIQETKIIKVYVYDYTVDEPVSFWRFVWSEAAKEK